MVGVASLPCKQVSQRSLWSRTPNATDLAPAEPTRPRLVNNVTFARCRIPH